MSISTEITALTNDRNAIRNALIEKDVDASTHGFDDFAFDISSIVSGNYAFLIVNYPSGATVSVTNTSGSKAISSTKKLFYVSAPSSGTDITCEAKIEETGKSTKTQEVQFTFEGQSQEITMAFEWYVYKDGVLDSSLGDFITTRGTSSAGNDTTNKRLYVNGASTKKPRAGATEHSFVTEGYTKADVTARKTGGTLDCTVGFGTDGSSFVVSQNVSSSFSTYTIDISSLSEIQEVYFVATNNTNSDYLYITEIRLY